MKINKFFHQYKIELSIFLTIFGAILVLFTGLGILAEEGSGSIFSTIKESLGGWIYWLIITGTVVLLLGVFYLFDFVSKRRQFYKLFNEESKSKFIKNMDRIEELAWRLHPKFEMMVIERKNKWKIK